MKPALPAAIGLALSAASADACTAPPAGHPPLSPTEVVHRQVLAYNAHDVDAFAACYSPDIRIYRSNQGEAPASIGLDQLRAHYTALFKANPKRRADIIGRISTGDFVSDSEFLPDVNLHVIATYEVKNGLITRVWLHAPPLP